MRNEVSLRVYQERNTLHTVDRRKANWIVYILRGNCLLKQVSDGNIDGRIEVTGRRGRRGKQLQDDFKDRRIL